MRYDYSRPAKERVVSVSVGGRPLDYARSYRVATVDFLASGGDGYAGLSKGELAAGTWPASAREVVAAYLGKARPFPKPAGGRVESLGAVRQPGNRAPLRKKFRVR